MSILLRKLYYPLIPFLHLLSIPLLLPLSSHLPLSSPSLPSPTLPHALLLQRLFKCLHCYVLGVVAVVVVAFIVVVVDFGAVAQIVALLLVIVVAAVDFIDARTDVIVCSIDLGLYMLVLKRRGGGVRGCVCVDV